MLLVPSFYAFMSLSVAYVIFLFSSYSMSIYGHSFALLAIFFNLVSVFVFSPFYSRLKVDIGKPNTAFVFLFLTLGVVGLVEYIYNLGSYFGGLMEFVEVLLTAPYKIRWANTDLSNAPFLVYFGWVGFFLALLARKVGHSGVLIFFMWVLVALNFFGNFLFLDRTRPFWLIFFAILVYVLTSGGGMRVWVRFFVSLGGLLFVFVLIGFMVGKIELSSLYEKIEIYFISGFLYFDNLVFSSPDFSGFRLFYPLGKIFEALGVGVYVPPQILPFLDVPFSTNVATYLEPAFVDWGIWGVVIFLFFHSFILDYFALFLLRSERAALMLLWAVFCFCNFMAFFVPKINTTFVFFVFFIFVVYLLWSAFRSLLSGSLRVEEKGL